MKIQTGPQLYISRILNDSIQRNVENFFRWKTTWEGKLLMNYLLNLKNYSRFVIHIFFYYLLEQSWRTLRIVNSQPIHFTEPSLKRTLSGRHLYFCSAHRWLSADSRLTRVRICSVISSRSRPSGLMHDVASRVMSPCQARSSRASERFFYKDAWLSAILIIAHQREATRTQLPL